MGTATQNPGGPLLGTNIPPGMSYNAGTGAWTFSAALSVVGNVTAGSGGANNASLFAGNGTGTNAYVILNAAAGSQRGVIMRTAGSNRWLMQATTAAESGSDAGSNLSIDCFTDAGASIDSPASFLRASGLTMTFGGSTRRTVATTGGRVEAIDTFTDSATLNSTHHNAICNKATAMTITLPAAASHTGRVYFIKNINTGVVTVDANASELIDNATTQTLNQWQGITIKCNGSAWVIS